MLVFRQSRQCPHDALIGRRIGQVRACRPHAISLERRHDAAAPDAVLAEFLNQSAHICLNFPEYIPNHALVLIFYIYGNKPPWAALPDLAYRGAANTAWLPRAIID